VKAGFASAETDVLAHYVRAVLVPDGRYSRIRELLTSTDYLMAKIARLGPQELLKDVRAARGLAPDHASSAQLRKIETALVQSARILGDDPAKLCGQLLARIPRGIAQDVDKLLDEAAAWRGGTWLRPLSTVHHHAHTGSFGPVSGFVDALAISDDSSVVLVGDRVGGLSAWNVNTGESLWSQNTGSEVNAVAFRSASFEALVALGDGTVARWSLADRRLRPCLRDPRHSVAALAIAGDTLVYCAGNALHAYDLAAEVPLWRGEAHEGNVSAVAILADGQRCVSAPVEGPLTVWRLDDGRQLGHINLPPDRLLCATAVPGGSLVVVGTHNRRVISVDVDTGKVTVLRGHTNQVRSVAALADGQVVSGSYDGLMLVWDLAARNNRRVGTHARWCLAVAAPRKPGPLVSGADDGVVRVWENDGPPVPPMRKNRDVRALAVADGTVYAAVDRAVTRVDLATGVQRPSLTGHHGPVVTLAVTSAGRLVSGSYDGDIRLWDVASSEARVLKGHTSGADELVLTPDGAEIISVSRDGTWRRWNAVTGAAGPAVSCVEPFNSVVAVSPDGTLVVTAAREHTIEVWSRRDGRRVLPPLYGHTGFVERLAITSDGRTLLSASWDHSLRAWDLATGKPLAVFDHAKWVVDLALTSDGRLAFSACSDGSISVIDLERLEVRDCLAGHPNGTWHLALAPDERTLFSVGSDQTVRAWDVGDHSSLAVFDAEIGLNHIAVAGTDFVVVGTSAGTVIRLMLERAQAGHRTRLRAHDR